MANFEGNLLKMASELSEQVVYQLPLGNKLLKLNELIGNQINLVYKNEINCVACGQKTNKSFAQGYCYRCFVSAPETSECVLKPELCQAHVGISRDMEWSNNHCLTEHIVYLAISSDLKVGVTRATQVPTRWIDQGAWKAIKLASTPNRYLAGVIEVELKRHMSDKTSWQKMLQNKIASQIDLVEEKQKAWELLPPELQEYVVDDDSITKIIYPVIEYPEKLKSVSFDKTNEISGVLWGIKGQYLIFKDGQVFNVRAHSGYKVNFGY
jgi:hypothetical protein